MPKDPKDRSFTGVAYVEAYRKEYPHLAAKGVYPHNAFREWEQNLGRFGADNVASRYVPLSKRMFWTKQNAWLASRTADYRWAAASLSYKGLLNLKPPFDLVLYSNLIWELQPKTIIEFGALQGGSALWFADQLELMCGDGKVHSFELFTKAIHPRAKHPRLNFHAADMNHPEKLNLPWIKALPRPWLIVDDAHANMENVAPFMAELMNVGDYYIWEDIFLQSWSTPDRIATAVAITEKYNLQVDCKYADGFGYNVTCSPNAWFVKRPPAKPPTAKGPAAASPAPATRPKP